MGLSHVGTGLAHLGGSLIERSLPDDKIIALAGNPNVGKSTIFNRLTGLNQHTGNWPGKTVTNARGIYTFRGRNFILVDLPGTYSLMANSVEEEVARDFICFGDIDATVIVTDATCLERNLNLVLQTLEITSDVVVCVNLLDEAKRKSISINLSELSKQLGVPVVGTSASTGFGMDELLDAVYKMTDKKNDDKSEATYLRIRYDEDIEQAVSMLEPELGQILGSGQSGRWTALKLLDGDGTFLASLEKYLGFDLSGYGDVAEKLKQAEAFLFNRSINKDIFRDRIVTTLVKKAEGIYNKSVSIQNERYDSLDRRIDSIVTSKIFAIPIMLVLLGFIFWLTIVGANYPSELISDFLFGIEDCLSYFFTNMGTPAWAEGVLVEGVYRTLAWVVSVMLPPMAIFFPLFTLLEDLGYLPRIAFNLDNFFKKACAHGRQALSMCMGFGCNAAGVVGCRIIDSPRERLIATITNNFVPCNGRLPTLIAIITMFFVDSSSGSVQSAVSALLLTGLIVLVIFMTLAVSKILSSTLLKGLPSSFTLELPPYRKPQVGKIIVRSIFDRTLFVLCRAVLVAAPSGAVIWALANIKLCGLSLLACCANFLDPFAKLIGLDGYILLAFILGLPANEIVVPIIIMCYTASGSMLEFDSLVQLKILLVSNGWTRVTALCVMLFSLMHWPCGTTCLTIKNETRSLKWTLVSVLIPTIAGMAVCFIVANSARLIGLIL